MGQEMRDDATEAAEEENFKVASVEGMAVAASAVLLASLMRSSSLLALALSSLPLWRRVDPMAVLALSDEQRAERKQALRAARKAEDENSADIGELLDGEGSKASSGKRTQDD
jgi:hypothetical protein